MSMAASGRITGCISFAIMATFAGRLQFVHMSVRTALPLRGIILQTWRECIRMLSVPLGY